MAEGRRGLRIHQGLPSSDPYDLTVFHDAIRFGADDGIHGNELWATTATGSSCPVPIVVDPGVLPPARVGVPYTATITASGGVGPYRFVPVGTLPPGLTLSPAGVLSGTPTTAGPYRINVRAIDATGCRGRGRVRIQVHP